MIADERCKVMPQCAEWVAQITAEFGYPVAIRASENGHFVNWSAKGEKKMADKFTLQEVKS